LSFTQRTGNLVKISAKSFQKENIIHFSSLVRVKGLEPPRIAAPDPKSGVSTNSTTLALNSLRYDTCQTLSSGFESRALIAFYVAGRYSEKKN